jgi:hypothetical protein
MNLYYRIRKADLPNGRSVRFLE